MNNSDTHLSQKLGEVHQSWEADGLPTRSALLAEADRLSNWKKTCGTESLWSSPPLLVTATVDDGWGQGLEIIHRYAQVAGVRHRFLGLLHPPESIIDACCRLVPDFLGLTVLQFDSEDALKHISARIPAATLLIAGGPVLAADADFARQSGIHKVANSVADFVKFLLEWNPNADKRG